MEPDHGRSCHRCHPNNHRIPVRSTLVHRGGGLIRPEVATTIRAANDFDRQLLLDAQAENGAFPASTEFSQYNYCWFRDGAFIALALSEAGELTPASKYHQWAAATILKHAARITQLLDNGNQPPEQAMLPARFTVDGDIEADDWPNFQMDGYGQWLWVLRKHQDAGGQLPDRSAINLVADYVLRFWQRPCYDAWEEGRTQLHTSTLASCAAGLTAAAHLLQRPELHEEAARIMQFLTENCVIDGMLIKQVRQRAVDASVLWAIAPFELFTAGSDVAASTVAAVQADLSVDGGVMRYRADTYFGGGLWILLTAWLGWVELRAGQADVALQRWLWVQERRNSKGELPEQVTSSRTHGWFLHWWTDNWGASATRLLWSHALSLLLGRELLDDFQHTEKASA